MQILRTETTAGKCSKCTSYINLKTSYRPAWILFLHKGLWRRSWRHWCQMCLCARWMEIEFFIPTNLFQVAPLWNKKWQATTSQHVHSWILTSQYVVHSITLNNTTVFSHKLSWLRQNWCLINTSPVCLPRNLSKGKCDVGQERAHRIKAAD